MFTGDLLMYLSILGRRGNNHFRSEGTEMSNILIPFCLFVLTCLFIILFLLSNCQVFIYFSSPLTFNWLRNQKHCWCWTTNNLYSVIFFLFSHSGNFMIGSYTTLIYIFIIQILCLAYYMT